MSGHELDDGRATANAGNQNTHFGGLDAMQPREGRANSAISSNPSLSVPPDYISSSEALGASDGEVIGASPLRIRSSQNIPGPIPDPDFEAKLYRDLYEQLVGPYDEELPRAVHEDVGGEPLLNGSTAAIPGLSLIAEHNFDHLFAWDDNTAQRNISPGGRLTQAGESFTLGGEAPFPTLPKRKMSPASDRAQPPFKKRHRRETRNHGRVLFNGVEEIFTTTGEGNPVIHSIEPQLTGMPGVPKDMQSISGSPSNSGLANSIQSSSIPINSNNLPDFSAVRSAHGTWSPQRASDSASPLFPLHALPTQQRFQEVVEAESAKVQQISTRNASQQAKDDEMTAFLDGFEIFPGIPIGHHLDEVYKSGWTLPVSMHKSVEEGDLEPLLRCINSVSRAPALEGNEGVE